MLKLIFFLEVGLVVLGLGLVSQSSADPLSSGKLLDCNLAGGFQQVAVYREKSSHLILSVLDNRGVIHKSVLSESQWRLQNIILPCVDGRGSCGRLFYFRNSWVYQITLEGIYHSGRCL